MKKVVNFRPLFVIFISLALGIRCSKDIFSGDLKIILLLSFLIAVFLLFSVLRKNFIPIICALCAFCFGLGIFFLSYNLYIGKNYDSEVVISGRISETLYRGDYEGSVITNCTIGGEKSGNIYIYLSPSETLTPGDVIVFTAKPKTLNLFKLGKMQSSYYRKNVKYTVSVSDYEVQNGEKNLSEKFKSSVKELLDKNMGEAQAELAYSVLFGDTSEIDPNTYTNFKTSGTVHILAVSGLHVGFLAGLLYFILGKCKLPRWLQFLITAAVLLSFAYLCGFTPSVTRATIMTLVFLSAGVFGKPYDLLTSVAVSGLIILLIKPLYVFDIGFLLSFFCVLSIALFAKNITRGLIKIKIPNAIASSMALTISTQIGILPFMANYFGNVSFFVIFANMIIIPLFALGFTLLVAFTLICLPLKFLGFLLFIPDIIFKTIIILVGFFAALPILVLEPIGTEISLIYFLALFVASGFVLLNLKIKLCISAVLLSACFCFACLPKNYIDVGTISFIQIDNTNESSMICFSNGKVISFNPDEALTETLLSKIYHIEAYYVKLKNKGTVVETNFSADDEIGFEVIENLGRHYGVLISYKGYKIFYATTGRLSADDKVWLSGYAPSVDILYQKNNYEYNEVIEAEYEINKDGVCGGSVIGTQQLYFGENLKQVRCLD